MVCSEKPVTSRPSLEQAAHHSFEKWLKRESPSSFPALVLGLGEGGGAAGVQSCSREQHG